MTFSVDDNGNVRVDFVWGNMAMQPDQGRTDTEADWVGSNNQPQDRGWSERSYGITSDTLHTTVTQYLTLGDQSYDDNYQNPDTRSVTVPTIHDIVTTGYNNFPEFLPNYAGDGDAGLEIVVPELSGSISQINNTLEGLGLVLSVVNDYVGATLDNNDSFKSQSPAVGTIVNPGSTVTVHWYSAPQVPNLAGLTEAAATTALTNAHLTKGAVTTADNAAGATALNDGKIKSQTPAAGNYANTGSAVALVKYAYTVEAYTTGPISGFNRLSGTSFSLNGSDAIMYLTGRTVKPTLGDTITVSGTTASAWNQTWLVAGVEDNDSYNSGGTAVKISAIDDIYFGSESGASSTGGTWTKI